MAEPSSNSFSFDVADGQPLIGRPMRGNGRQITHYFTDEAAAAALAQYRRDARYLAGAWARIDPDLDWDELADELDRIRHESPPTPPIDLDI